LRCGGGRPGAHATPPLALAAMIAAGLHGMDSELELEPRLEGNAYTSRKPRVPGTLREAHDLFAKSKVGNEAFGEDFGKHYLNPAPGEVKAFGAVVTDWE